MSCGNSYTVNQERYDLHDISVSAVFVCSPNLVKSENKWEGDRDRETESERERERELKRERKKVKSEKQKLVLFFFWKKI